MGRWAAGQALPRRPASDDYFFFFFAAFFAGAFFFAAAMIHLSSVLRPLMRPLRNVSVSEQPVEGRVGARRHEVRRSRLANIPVFCPEGSNRDRRGSPDPAPAGAAAERGA